MERESMLSTPEIVGVAAASAAALGGVIVALGRSQASSARERVEAIEAAKNVRISRERVDRGRELARGAAASVLANYPELRDSAVELVNRAATTAKPRAEQVGSSAASTADQVRTTGATMLDKFQSEVLPAATTALSGLAERAGEARDRSAPSASDMKAVATAKADVALAKSSSAAKDSLATVAWTASALAIIYFILLSPERREQLKNTLWGAIDQTLVLVRDFQGYEDDF